MAYAASGLRILVPAFAGSGNVWMYESADAASAVDASGYISDGGKYGMQVGDIVIVRDTATGIISTHRVVTVSATTYAVDLGDGTTIGSSTNTD